MQLPTVENMEFLFQEYVIISHRYHLKKVSFKF
jgi:hypothetical protein